MKVKDTGRLLGGHGGVSSTGSTRRALRARTGGLLRIPAFS